MINQTILLKQLRKRGIVAEAANHGQAALDRLRQVCSTAVMPSSELDKPFDVVLLDLEMPIMDGMTAITILRDEERAGKLRRSHVIALTGNARQQQIDDALAAGMDSGESENLAHGPTQDTYIALAMTLLKQFS